MRLPARGWAIILLCAAAATGASAQDNAGTVATQAMLELFKHKDPRVVDRWFADPYIQHNLGVADGLEGLEELVTRVHAYPDLDTTIHRVLVDGDIAVLHSVYTGLKGLGPTPVVAFDMFRVKDGLIHEHWDALTPVTGANLSGHTQVDGPTKVADREKTDANRTLVRNYVETVLVGAQHDKMGNFVNANQFVQHSSGMADGQKGFLDGLESLTRQGKKLEYSKLHRVVADGNFVVAHSEVNIGGKPAASFNLFRVDNGKIVEHWDVVAPLLSPDQWKNKNGAF